MIVFPAINWLTVVIGFVISSILGFLWYDARTPIGAFYMKEMGYDAENLDVNNLHFGLDFLGRFLLILGFSFFISWSGAETFVEGLTVALLFWGLFIVTTHWAQVAFEQRKSTVYGIYIAYQLVVLLILGPIFALN